MKTPGFTVRSWVTIVFISLVSLSISAQTTGGGSSGSIPARVPREAPPSFATEMNRPLFVSGNVILSQGGPLPEPVAIHRVCGGNSRKETTTDSKGHFSFMLGDNPNSFQDASQNTGARVDGPVNSMTARQLQNCEIRAYLTGYTSTTITLAGRNLVDMPNVGTIVLSKASSGSGDSISATSFAAPDDAKKAYDKGREAFDKKKYEDSEKQLTKAVGIYPAYAMAWDLLGRTQEVLKKNEDARKSYEAAIKADDKFVLPHLRLAVMASNKPDWATVLSETERVVALDPTSYPYAYFLRGAAYFNTGQTEEALQAALKAVEVDTDHKFPRTELLAGTILQRKGDHTNAIPHLKAFLKLQPNSPEASSIQQYLTSQNASIDPATKQ